MTKFFVIVASAVSIASPVLAADPHPAGSEQPVAMSAAPGAQQQRPQAVKRYCVQGTITGSRLLYKECHTMTEWKQMGIDPLNDH